MNRRQFSLKAGTAAALAGGSGCVGVFEPRGLRLGGVILINQQSTEVKARLRVTRDETTVLEERHSLASAESTAGTSVLRDDAWEDRVAVYEVAVDVESGRSDAFEYTADHSDGECTIAHVEIREGTIAFGSHRATESTRCRSAESPD